MAKVKKDQEQQVEAKLVDSSTGDVVATITEIEPAAFPGSSVDSAFAAREAEAPVGKIISSTAFESTVDGQLLANVVPAATIENIASETPPETILEKVIGSEAHGTTFDGLLKQVSSPSNEASQIATGEAILSAMDRINPPEDDEEEHADALRDFAEGAQDVSGETVVEASWAPTHRVVTPDSVYLVMVVELGKKAGDRSYAWTHPEYYSGSVTRPELVRESGHWKFKGEPFTGNVHSLAPAAPDRHTHRREPVG